MHLTALELLWAAAKTLHVRVWEGKHQTSTMGGWISFYELEMLEGDELLEGGRGDWYLELDVRFRVPVESGA